MNPSNTPAADLLALARQVFETLSPAGTGASVALTGNGLRVTIARDAPLDSAAPCVQVRSEMGAAILGVLHGADRPLKITQLALRLNYDSRGYFRRVVGQLVLKGHVLRLPGDRYWLAARPLLVDAATQQGRTTPDNPRRVG